MTVEVGGKLWKPLPGATVSAAEFTYARSLIMEIREAEQWNPWAREDRAGEYEAVSPSASSGSAPSPASGRRPARSSRRSRNSGGRGVGPQTKQTRRRDCCRG